MDVPPALLAAAHDNYVESFRLLGRALPGGDVLDLNGGELILSGRPDAEFNRLFVWDAPADAAGLLARAAEACSRRRCGWTVVAGLAANRAVREAAKGARLRAGMPQAAMVLASLDEVGPAGNIRGLVIEPVESPAMADTLVAVLEDGFGVPAGFYRSYGCPGVWDAPEIRCYLGWLDDEAVACAAVLLSGEMAGLYHVSTIKEFRKMGLADALGRHALREAAETGCRAATLQPTMMGYSIYTRIGFRPAFSYASWYSLPP